MVSHTTSDSYPEETLVEKLDRLPGEGIGVLHFTDQFPGHIRNSYLFESLEWYDCRGNLSFACSDERVARQVLDWSDGENKWTAPMSVGDVTTQGMSKLVHKVNDVLVQDEAMTAFPAELEQESREENTASFDAIESDQDIGDDTEQVIADEKAMIEELPLPGAPQFEKERRAQWLKLPRHARAAIRRMHAQFGHCPKAPLKEVLRAAKARTPMCRPSNTSSASHARGTRSYRSRLTR